MFKWIRLLVALSMTPVVLTGCGAGGDDSGKPGVGGVGSGIVAAGVIQPSAGSAATVTFTGTNVYDYGGQVFGMTPGFFGSQYQQYQTLSMSGATGVPGGAQLFTGQNYNYAGTTMQLYLAPTATYMANVATVVGQINLTAQFVQANFPNGVVNIQGVYINMYHYQTMNPSTGTYGLQGEVRLCTSMDSQGCRGVVTNFNP